MKYKVTKSDKALVKCIVSTFLVRTAKEKAFAAFSAVPHINAGDYLPAFLRPLRKIMVRYLTPIYVSPEWPDDHTDLLTAIMVKEMARQDWQWPVKEDATGPGVCLDFGSKITDIKACLIEQINSRVSLWENEDFFLEDEFDSFGHGTIKGLHNNDGITCVLVDNVPKWICDGLEPIDELPVEDVYQIFRQLL